MIGHEKIVEDLKLLADKGTLPHGYVFFGPAMVGKKMVARGLAGYLERGIFEIKESMGPCRSEDDGKNIFLSDCMVIEPNEKGSIGIDAAREIKNFLWQKPNASSRRTVIIDEAELLTTEAQNALLKITEEPPASSLIILVTSDRESILPTILSRLPSIHIGTVAEKEIVAWLMATGDWRQATGDKINLTKVRATEIAKKSFGKPGLALRLLSDENFRENIELAEKFLKSPKATRRDLIKKIIEPDEFDLRKFLGAVIMVLAWEEVGDAKSAQLSHKALALYERQTNFSLNPRLQLEALMM